MEQKYNLFLSQMPLNKRDQQFLEMASEFTTVVGSNYVSNKFNLTP